MIRFNLLNLLKTLESKMERKIRLKEVSEQSGCDKNALSRLVNHPEIVPSAAVIDKLTQYFFHQFKAYQPKGQGIAGRDRALMRGIISEFISVYPDAEEYWNVLPAEIRENRSNISADVIWGIYTELTKENPSESEIVDNIETFKKIMQDLKKQLSKADGNEKLKLSLSKEEAEKLHEFINARISAALLYTLL